MSDLIIIDGDLVMFDPSFTPATVVVLPGTFRAKGPATKGGKKLGIDGDERDVQVAGCMYTTPSFPLPGTGTLKIQQLMPNQKALKTKSGKKAVLLKGSKFIAAFEVQAPAQLVTPTGTVTDPLKQYIGTGEFQTMNQTFRGT